MKHDRLSPALRALLAGTAGLTAAVGAATWLAVPAAAGTERITSYVVHAVIQRSGMVQVTDAITYDFGAGQRHGILRDIPYLRGDGVRYEREFAISGIRVSSPDGAPTQLKVTRSGGQVQIQIGNPHRTISGTHTYVISYQAGGTLTRIGGRAGFYWNLVGTGWAVPISDISATVSAPADVTSATCYAGLAGSTTACTGVSRSGHVATFHQRSLRPGEGLTAMVGIPAASVTVPSPLLIRRWALADRLAPTPLGAGAGAVLLVAVGAWLLLPERWSRRRARALTTRHEPAAGLRPGQAGAVLTGSATPAHVVATVVDLAIRGYLRIGTGGQHPDTWLLTRLAQPSPGRGEGARRGRGRGPQEVLRYERTLLEKTFAGGDEIPVSSLKDTFAPVVTQVCGQLTRDVIRCGWLRRARRPGAGWALIAAGAAIVIAGLPAWLPHGTAFFGAAVMLAGPLVMVAAYRDAELDTRTPEGVQVLSQIRSYRKRLRQEDPAGHDPWAAFSGELPYAIAFGLVAGWTERFTTVRQSAPEFTWWSSGAPQAGIWPAGLAMLTQTMCAYAPPPPGHHHDAGDLWSPGSGSGYGTGGMGGGMGGGMVGGGAGGGGGGSW